MFLELVQPKVMDRCDTADRLKIRIGERGSDPRFWVNLTFTDKATALAFCEDLNFQLQRISVEYHGTKQQIQSGSLETT